MTLGGLPWPETPWDSRGMAHSTACYLPQSDRAELLSLLRQSQLTSLELLDDVPDRAWLHEPAPGRWSIGHIAEHLLIAENVLFEGAKTAVEAPFNPNWPRWTGQNRPFVDTAKPAISGVPRRQLSSTS